MDVAAIYLSWWGRWNMEFSYSFPFWDYLQHRDTWREKVSTVSLCSNCCLLQNTGQDSPVLMHCVTAGRSLHQFIISRTKAGRKKHKSLFLAFAFFFFFLSKALIQKLLFIIASIKPWESILASSILLLKNKHFSSIKIAIQLFFCFHGNLKSNNKKVGDVIRQINK